MTFRPSRAVTLRIAALGTALFFTATCTGDRPSPLAPGSSPVQYVTPTGLLTGNPPQIFIGAGDIASCSNNDDEATAQIIDTIPGTVYVLGDNVYPNGTDSEYANCYDPNWGRFKARTKPSAGNHDYNTNGATGYYNYFGAAAGDPDKGYYSYELGAWHIIVLNSNITRSAGSPQDDWLIADLAAHPNQCKLAYFHHPLYSSTGGSGSGGATYSSVRRFWDDLYDGGTDLVLGGHRHFYERLAPMRPDGTRDDANGIREIIAGTGGIGGGSLTNTFPTSEVRNGDTRGVLKLYLYDDSYAWKFIPVAGKTFTDSGSTACHASGGSSGGGSDVSADQSSVSAAPASIAADGTTSTITVTARDANGDPVSGVAVVVSATGTGNTIVQPVTPTDANGEATGTLRSTVAEDKTVSATADGVSLTQTATVAVTPGPVDADLSTVTAAPTSITEGTGTATITVTAVDAHGNPIANASVVLDATGSGNTLGQPATPTDANGVATGTFSSTVSELKTLSATIAGTAVTQTATVLVNPPGVTGTITHTLLDAGNNASNGKVYTTASIAPLPDALVTVAVLSRRSGGALTPTVTGGGMPAWVEVASEDFDTQNSPQRRLTIFRAMSSSPGSGPITITFSSSVSNAQWIVSQWQGVDPSGTNGAGAIAQVGGTASDAASSLLVPLAPFGDPNDVAYAIAGITANGPAITAGAGFTAIAEQSSGEKSDLGAEWATNQTNVSASWPSSLRSGLLAVELKAGGGGSGTPTVSAALSTVDAAPGTITAGSGAATITVTVNDGSGTPMSGVMVQLDATGTGNTLTQPAGPTDANGVATGTLSSTVAAPKTISATAGGVPITQTASVTVTPGAVSSSASTLTAAPTSIEAGTGTATITVTVLDDNGNSISGAMVHLDATGTGNVLTQPANPTDVDGVATGTLASSDAEDKTVSATIDGTTAVDQVAVVTVTPGSGSGVSASLSSVAIAPTSAPAGGGPATITVTVRDGTGTPMSNVNVSLVATGTGNTLTQPSGPTDVNGVATGTLNSTVAEDKTVTATADGTDLSTQPVLTVTAAAVDADQSTVTASPTSIVAGTGTATITVTARDAYGNRVPDKTVNLSTGGTNYTLTQPIAPTDATGVATGSLSATDVQTLVVSASADAVPLTQTASIDVTAAPPAAAISHTLLTSGIDPANGKVYTTASIAPAPNTLVLVAVLGHRAYGAPPAPTVTGGGMTSWDEVATVTLDPQSSGLKRMTIFRAMSPAPGSGPLTITFSATVSNAEWIVSEFSGVDQGGTNGSGAIVQTGSVVGDGVNGLTVPLAPFADVNDVAYGAFGVASGSPAVTAGAGFTTIAEEPSGETPADLFAEWMANDPNVDASWNSLNGGALAIELKAGTGP